MSFVENGIRYMGRNNMPVFVKNIFDNIVCKGSFNGFILEKDGNGFSRIRKFEIKTKDGIKQYHTSEYELYFDI